MPFLLKLVAALGSAGGGDPVTSPLVADTTGDITVVVIDSLENLLPQVDLVLRNDSTGRRWIGRTNRNGIYRFAGVPANQSFTLLARRIGLSSETKKFSVEPNQDLMVTVILARPTQRLADISTGRLTGDIEGRLVPFAANEFRWALLDFTDSSGGYKKRVTVGRKGEFSLTGIPAGGPYVLTVRAMGFETQRIGGIEIVAGNTVVINPILFWTGTLDVFGVAEKFKHLDTSCPRKPRYYLNGVYLGTNVDPPLAPLILSEIKPQDIIERQEFSCDSSIPPRLRNSVWIKARVDRNEILANRARTWKRDRPWYFLGYGVVATMVGGIIFF